jgi:hypothetical protein
VRPEGREVERRERAPGITHAQTKTGVNYEHHECGGLTLLLPAAPDAVPVRGRINGLIHGDAFDRAPGC